MPLDQLLDHFAVALLTLFFMFAQVHVAAWTVLIDSVLASSSCTLDASPAFICPMYISLLFFTYPAWPHKLLLYVLAHLADCACFATWVFP